MTTQDVLAIAGCILIVIGIALMHIPSALIVTGLSCFAIALLIQREKDHETSVNDNKPVGKAIVTGEPKH